MRFLIFLGLAVAASALAPFFDAGEHGIKGRYIVVLKKGMILDHAIGQFQGAARDLSLEASVKRQFKLLNGFVALVNPESGLELLRSLPGVDYVEEDEMVFADAVGSWGLDRIDQRYLPLDGSMRLNGNGQGAHVYVIDSGINENHVDFGGRAHIGADFIGGDGVDCNGHGTHCAGTVASNTYGVATGAQVYGLRTLDCSGSGYKSDSIAALEWVSASSVRPAIASMSLGGSKSTSQNQAVADAKAAGVVVVVSAGNDDGLACNKSPASAPEALTVGSTTSSDVRSYFSNYGSCVDIFAPGSSITSLRHDSNTGTSVKSGTSMSCPHVSGIAAVLAANQGWNYNSDQVYEDVINTATSGVLSDIPAATVNLMAYLA